MTAVDLTALAHIEARAKMIGAQVQIVPGTSSLLFVSRHGVTETVTDAERLDELLREDQSEEAIRWRDEQDQGLVRAEVAKHMPLDHPDAALIGPLMVMGMTREEAEAYARKQLQQPTRQDRIDEAAMEIVRALRPMVRSSAKLTVETIRKAQRK